MQDVRHLVGDPACLVIVFFGTPDRHSDVFRSRDRCHRCDMGKTHVFHSGQRAYRTNVLVYVANVSVAALITQEIALRCFRPVVFYGETYLWCSWSLFIFPLLAHDFKNYRHMTERGTDRENILIDP